MIDPDRDPVVDAYADLGLTAAVLVFLAVLAVAAFAFGTTR